MKIISVLFLVFLMGCSNGNSNKSKELAEVQMSPPPSAEVNSINDETVVRNEQKVIKTAHLNFEVSDVSATQKKILQLANEYKGFVQSDNTGKEYSRVFQTMVIRVPSENFQPFLDNVSKAVEYFDQKEISRQDVSEEFVDLEARLSAKRELEKRYLELLKQAKNVKEMLEIERELSIIREEIEAKQGRLQFLQNQVSLSTINLHFYKTTADTGVTQSYGQKMKNAFFGGWNGISVFFLGMLYLWPLFLLASLVFLFLRIFLKKRKKKH
ncbi:DUF4349 domain-containing protein [Aequorivita echinoideorum]|uniref:DUF4349 domain-containing protein n=1 Tax=Aequorivita echinoideorum TaxID=1549647 RepID=A0ABS5S408_9FLAO|nr:DUF4349 domain-containing protein [Aequorivita echinoideorum]MBT0607122.1 DUF4349 domain-containing protein [Aequorivita echinoideorum]